MSTAITQGIRVSVKSRFLPEQSGAGRYAFAYTVRIENLGQVSAQLKSRHWIITDGNGKREEVRGEGVVGNQPMLRPGEQFEYTSGAQMTARKWRRIRTLLLLGDGLSARETAKAVGCYPREVRRIGHRYREKGLEGALGDEPRPTPEPLLDSTQQAAVVAMVCGPP